MDEATIDQNYREAFAREDFQQAAEFLNGLDVAGIHQRLTELDARGAQDLHQGALDNPRLGSESNVARMTRTDNEPSSDADANTVFAGEHFRIKMLDGFSMGDGAGVSSGLFAVWDLDNNRRAFYRYLGVMVCAGVPISDGGEGDWSEVVTPPRPAQIDQFGGVADFAQASVAVVGMWGLTLHAVNVSVDIPTFFSKSFGFESGTGVFSLLSGSVEVFSGP